MKVESFEPNTQKWKTSHRRTSGLCRGFIVLDMETRKNVLEVRMYETKSNVYACLWVRQGNAAQGSAATNIEKRALLLAAKNAGFVFEDSNAYFECNSIIEAIAQHLCKDYHIFEVYP